MKILITGCCGFIGSHLTEYLSENTQHDIIGIDDMTLTEINKIQQILNLKIIKDLDRFTFINDNICSTNIISQMKPDVVVHLAGLAGVRKSLEDPEKYIYNNIGGHTRLLKQSVDNNVKKFIYASSSSVYGDRLEYKPFKETDSISTLKSPYALSKFTCENMSNILQNDNIKIIGCRFFSVYGPRGRSDMAPFKFFKNILNNEVIDIFGDGHQKRDFTYILDVIKSLSHLIESKKEKLAPIYNIGNNTPISIIELLNIIESQLNKKALLNFRTMCDADVQLTYCDNNLFYNDFGFRPETSIHHGISKMIQYHLF